MLHAPQKKETKFCEFVMTIISFKCSEMKRTQGDGSNFPDGTVPSGETGDGMTSHELKEAIITMMMRKDEVEDQNK